MLRFKIEELVLSGRRQDLASVADSALRVLAEQGSYAAMTEVVDKIGIALSNKGEGYYIEALHFQLAFLRACAGEPEAMAEHLRLSHTMPGPNQRLLFSEHLFASMAIDAQRRAGIQRGLPAILIASMPRSGSGTLTESLGRLLSLPVCNLSFGVFPDQYIGPSWLDMFLEGGAVMHDHFGANDFNIGVLSGRGQRDMFVLVRDPRAAARSFAHLRRMEGFWGNVPEAEASLEEQIERICLSEYIPWFQGWIDCVRSDKPFHVHWLTFQGVRQNLTGTVRRIATILARDCPIMEQCAELDSVPETRVHFISGDDDAWRAEVGEDCRRRMWEACSSDMKNLLSLQP